MNAGVKFGIVVVLVVAVSIVGWKLLQPVLFSAKPTATVVDDSLLHKTNDPNAIRAGAGTTPENSVVASGGGVPQKQQPIAGIEVVDDEEAFEEEEEELTPEEIAVRDWEALAETLQEADFTADAEVTRKIKTAFDALKTDEDREIGMHTMMNLISDGAVQALFPILLDTRYETEILDIIFDDILNRDDEIKYPILEAIVKDPTHPHFVDAAHILEVTQPDEGPVVIEEIEIE